MKHHYIFNHVPKTGGTSLLAVFRENLAPEEISPPLFDFEIRFKVPARFERYRLISGHFSMLKQMAFCRNRYSITILRDPIKRIISNYKYNRFFPGGHFLQTRARDLSFPEFVRYFQDSPALLHNCYCHHFAGIGSDVAKYPVAMDNLLATAEHNLAAFDFVGLTEEFDRSVGLLCHEMGWRHPGVIPHENRSVETAFEIDPETLNILQERNQFDLILYEHARDLFHKREAVASGKSDSTAIAPEERNRFVPFPAALSIERKASIHSVRAHWLPDASLNALEIEVNFRTVQPAGELSLGIAVADVDGSILYALNTAYGGLVLQHGVGLDTRATFVLECTLSAGTYVITVALSDARRLGFHEHWIDSAAQFAVLPRQASDSNRVRSVCLKRFESVAYRANEGTQPEQGVVSLGRFSSGNSAYRPQAVLDLDKKLSNPRVCLKMETKPTELYFSGQRRIVVSITNLGDETLSTRYTYPVMLSYHWLSDDGTVMQHDGLRSELACDILPGNTSSHEMIIGPPPHPRCMSLSITLVQELVCWFDDRDPNNRLLVHMRELEALAA